MYIYQVDWFTPQLSLWEKYLIPLEGQPHISFLEIGSFEGRSAVWLLKHVLTHETAHIVCIDPFHGSIENQNKPGLDLSKIEANFDHNIKETESAHKVTKIKKYSHEAYVDVYSSRFDFIYIDGSHTAPDVLSDAVMYFHLLKVGGIMIFDDYEWNEPGMTGLNTPKPAVDAFFSIYCDSIEVLHLGIQAVIKRKK